MLNSLSWQDMFIAFIIGALCSMLLIPIVHSLALPLSSSWRLLVLVLLPLASALFVGVASVSVSSLAWALQIARFILVGALNTLIDLALFNILFSLAGLNSPAFAYPLIKALSFSVAVVNSYVWNRYWVFNHKQQTTKKEVVQFFTISVIGLILNTFIAWLVFLLLNGHISRTIGSNIGAIAGTLAVLAWNFVGYKFIVFKQ